MTELTKPASLLDRVRNPAILAMGSLFLINVVSYADRSVLTVLQEPMKADLKLTDFQLGLLAGPVFAVMYGVFGIPIARLAERHNRKFIILAAVSVWSCFTAMCGLAHNFVQIALARMGVGAAEAAAPPATHSLISDYFSRSARGRAMAILALGIPLGTMVGGLIGGTVAQMFDWRIAFAAVGLPGLLIAAVAAKLMYEAPRGGGHVKVEGPPLSFWQSLKMLLAIPVYRYLLLAAVLSGNASHAISAFSASYFIRAHELTLVAVGGILLTGKGIAGMLGTVASGFASDKLDRGKGQDYLLVPAVGSIFAAGLLWLSFGVPDVNTAIALFIVAGFFANMVMSPAFAAVQNVVDVRTRATAAALFLFCVTVPGAAGPPVVGYVSDTAAAASMQLDVEDYHAACPGGRAAKGSTSAAPQNASCRTASTVGLQTGMTVGIVLYLLATLVYLLAVWAGRRDVKNRGA